MLPSVTTIINSKFPFVTDEDLKLAQYRGTEVHSACHAYVTNTWYPLDREFGGYIESFTLWYDLMVEEFIFGEERIIDYVLGFSGKPDLVVKLMGDKGFSLWDIKTSAAMMRSYEIQVAGYKHLIQNIEGIPIERYGGLQLFKDGRTAKIKEYQNFVYSFDVLMALLTIHRWEKNL